MTVVTPPTFPMTFRGATFPKRSPVWEGARVVTAASGNEIRAQNWAVSRTRFEISYEGLASDDANLGLIANSFWLLRGLYEHCGGQFGTFLFADPIDTLQTNRALGVGDGVKTTFPIVRSIAGYVVAAPWVLTIKAVYVNGVAQGAGWDLVQPNSLVFVSAPAVGAAISITFTFAYICRFDMTQLDFDQIFAGVHSSAAIKFITVKSS